MLAEKNAMCDAGCSWKFRNSLRKTCVGDFFKIKSQAFRPATLLKRDPNTCFTKRIYFEGHQRTAGFLLNLFKVNIRYTKDHLTQTKLYLVRFNALVLCLKAIAWFQYDGNFGV